MTASRPIPPTPTHLSRFLVRQKISMTGNRYLVFAAGAEGDEGALLAFAEQKRLTLTEEVQFFTDETKRTRAFSFTARQRLDVGAEHDVRDDRGEPIGRFGREFGASLLRTTWTLAAPGLEARGQERRPLIALLRRVWTLIPVVGDLGVPFVFHVDFVDTTTGAPVMTSERRASVKDRYVVTVQDPRLDFRVAAAMAVALDALESR